MKTLFLRFPNEASALAAFSAVTGAEVSSLADVPSKVEVGGFLCDVDPIGALTHATGAVDADGYAITVPVEGFHVNIWTPNEAVTPAPLLAFVVEPTTPSRIFG